MSMNCLCTGVFFQWTPSPSLFYAPLRVHHDICIYFCEIFDLKTFLHRAIFRHYCKIFSRLTNNVKCMKYSSQYWKYLCTLVYMLVCQYFNGYFHTLNIICQSWKYFTIMTEYCSMQKCFQIKISQKYIQMSWWTLRGA